MKRRFRGYLPVVIDVETAGFNERTDALLELAAVQILLADTGELSTGQTEHYHVYPFEGANLDSDALAFHGIIPDHPFRYAINESAMLSELNHRVGQWMNEEGCVRAVLVGHNAHFDLKFLQAAYTRCQLKSVFHRFTSFDTATLSAAILGETVLAKSLIKSGLSYDPAQAHSALYDARQTAELFCRLLNQI